MKVVKQGYFVVTLALKMLIYALVNCAFSGFASLKLVLLYNFMENRGCPTFQLDNLIFLLSLDKLLGKPSSYRLIVEFKDYICQDNHSYY